LPTYHFIYDLPNDQFGAAWLGFVFSSGIKVSDYGSIDFTIQFSQATTGIQLVLIDMNDAKDSILISNTGTEADNVSYPLNNFKKINLNSLKSITFFTQTNENTGHHEITIQNIHFVK
jgi:hypothetical protein